MDGVLGLQIATGLLSLSTAAFAIGWANASNAYHEKFAQLRNAHRKIDEAHNHVRNLQKELSDAWGENDKLERQALELGRELNRIDEQRTRALKVAHARNAERNAARLAEKQAARTRTVEALAASPLRPRSEVVADVQRHAIA